MGRRIFTVAIVGIMSATLAGGVTQAAASPGQLAMHPGSVALAGTVNVAALPAVSEHAASALLRQQPFGTRAGNSWSTAAPSASVAAPRGPLLAIAAGTQLSAALKDADNPVALTPPDMGVGADSTHVVQMINVVGKIWKGTVPGAKFTLTSFFLGGTDFLSDPWVMFDQESGRWFAGIGDFTLGGERIAVSKTGDPTGGWNVYFIQYPAVAGGCPDQAKAGIDTNVLALGFNEFGGPNCTGPFLGAAIEVFNKAQMLAGATVSFAYTNPIAALLSLVPAQSLSPGQTTEYFAANSFNSTSKALHRLTSVGVPPATTLAALADLTLAHTYPAPPMATQPGTTITLNSGDQRMQHVVFKGGVGLLMSWTEACKPTGDTATRDCARIVATNDGAGVPAVTMDVDLSKKMQYYFYPAATLNSANDVVVDFGVSGAAIFPQLDAAAAHVGGPFGPPLVLVKGNKPNATTRYGDYFAVALDPSGTTPNRNVWAAGEIGGPVSNDWQTAIREVNVTP